MATPTAAPASGVKTLSVGDAGSITTASGDRLTISAAGVVMLNGSEIPGGDGASAVAHDYGTKLIYVQGDGTHQWFVWSPHTSWVSSAAPPKTGAPSTEAAKPASLDASRASTGIVKPGQTLTDTDGAEWSMVASPTKGMQLARNGSIMAATADAQTAFIHNAKVHYVDSASEVRVWDGAKWDIATNPLGAM